jgi:hypothetical protein
MKEILFRCVDTITTGSNPESKNDENFEICNLNSYSACILPELVKLVRLRDLDVHENVPNTLDFNKFSEKYEHIKDVFVTDRTGLLLNRKKDDDFSVHPVCRWEEDEELYDFNRRVPEDINLFYVLREPAEGFGESICFLKLSEPFRKKFKAIFTHNEELLNEKYENVYAYPFGTTLLKDKTEFKIYNKNKLVSFFYSGKDWWEGHVFRKNSGDYLKKLKLKNLDISGPLEYKNYITKIKTLQDYKFSVQIENVFEKYFFTDKIVDSFLTGTVPIYKGCTNIEDYFNKDGIITFDTKEELKDIISNLSDDDYKSREKAIKENFEKAKEYIHPEDWIYKNYKHLFSK